MTVTQKIVTCASLVNRPMKSGFCDVARKNTGLLGEGDVVLLSVTTSLYFDVVPTFLPICPLGLRQTW
ncbi:hypothetical protein V5799_020994 [Amblyomma americanum]|uniref:Uncharacterized protein n=1 Tax=Amblyomma americanum TaxID=6943 RepID=A0AAQ4FS72_AMBAM